MAASFGERAIEVVVPSSGARSLLVALLALGALAVPTAALADAPAAAHPATSSAALGNADDGFIPEEPAPGREFAVPRARPTEACPETACSLRWPMCVHAPRGASPAAILATLAAADRAYAIFEALGLPTPLPDLESGRDVFDVYLVAGAEPALIPVPLASTNITDRASAFAVLPPPSGSGCRADARVAYAVAEAAMLSLDAAAEPVAIAASAGYLAHLAAPCTAAELEGVDAFQRAPEAGLVDARIDAPAQSLLFGAFLDEAYGTTRFGRILPALLAVATQKTPARSWWWNNEPDIFDALRSTMKSRNSSLDDLLIDFAVARAFVGARSDGAHLTDTERFGDLGRVRFEWSVPYATLPRRLAPLRPIAPTGSTYTWLDLTGAPPDTEITAVAEWELGAVFRWALVKVDRQGVETGRLDLAGIYGATRVERSITVRDLAGLLVVGVHVGGLDRSHPFDPDEAAYGHSFTLTLFKPAT